MIFLFLHIKEGCSEKFRLSIGYFLFLVVGIYTGFVFGGSQFFLFGMDGYGKQPCVARDRVSHQTSSFNVTHSIQLKRV